MMIHPDIFDSYLESLVIMYYRLTKKKKTKGSAIGSTFSEQSENRYEIEK